MDIWNDTGNLSSHSRIIEAAWAAGFFDGEGTTFSNRLSLQVSIGQVNIKNLQRFMHAVGGLGAISGPKAAIGRQPIYAYQVYGPKAISVLAEIWGYLGAEKQAQALRAVSNYAMRHVAVWRGGDFCARGHRFSDVGYTSKRQCKQCRDDGRKMALPPIRKIRALEARIGVREYAPLVQT